MIYLIYCYNILGVIPMDYNDYIDNSDEDNSYDVENDNHDDEELYDLAIAGCHVVVTYLIGQECIDPL